MHDQYRCPDLFGVNDTHHGRFLGFDKRALWAGLGIVLLGIVLVTLMYGN